MNYELRITIGLKFTGLALLLSTLNSLPRRNAVKAGQLATTWLLPLLLLAAIDASLSTALAQGSLTPPGAPAPTMKSLDQIEPRTPISSAPFTITQPGSYYLTSNVNVSSGNAITIATNGVALNLNGFSISSAAASATGSGIVLNSGLKNITIANGFIQSGVTNNGSGTYTGSGFGYGINYVGIQPVNVLVSRVTVSGVLLSGIGFVTYNSTVVESCTVQTSGGSGLVAGIIKNSWAADCGGTAIQGYQVSDCYGQSVGGYGLYANNSALNCYGYSSSGYGLYASYSALNCYGYTSSGNYAILTTTAMNCYCQNNTGTYGLSASTAINCYATSGNSVGTGISAYTAENCYGSDFGGGYGIYASYIAQNCVGYSVSGTGLYAFIASVCHGLSPSGTPLSTSHNVNSF